MVLTTAMAVVSVWSSSLSSSEFFVGDQVVGPVVVGEDVGVDELEMLRKARTRTRTRRRAGGTIGRLAFRM